MVADTFKPLTIKISMDVGIDDLHDIEKKPFLDAAPSPNSGQVHADYQDYSFVS